MHSGISEQIYIYYCYQIIFPPDIKLWCVHLPSKWNISQNLHRSHHFILLPGLYTRYHDAGCSFTQIISLYTASSSIITICSIIKMISLKNHKYLKLEEEHYPPEITPVIPGLTICTHRDNILTVILNTFQ